jgi:hypothetical protein
MVWMMFLPDSGALRRDAVEGFQTLLIAATFSGKDRFLFKK